jgi:hypothetical protein
MLGSLTTVNSSLTTAIYRGEAGTLFLVSENVISRRFPAAKGAAFERGAMTGFIGWRLIFWML